MTDSDKRKIIDFLFEDLDSGFIADNNDLDCSADEFAIFLAKLHASCLGSMA